MTSTMQRLELEIEQLDMERERLKNPGYTQYTTTTTTTRNYTSEPQPFRSVQPPKPRQNLPPSGNRGQPPAPPPKTSHRHMEISRGYYSVPDDLPPPPAPVNSYGGDNEPLPPPPPEMSYPVYNDAPLPAPPAPMQSYTEPHPASQPSYARTQPYQPPPQPISQGYNPPKPSNQPASNPKSGLEAEVDALTDLLVQNMMSPTEEGEFFGICATCGKSVIGENSGCTAMDKVYHIDCFTCHMCTSKLTGQAFYALEGNSLCEKCYIKSQEKCSACSKTITDRILRATGKPYHPSCFKCVVCRKVLDGVPFTVDATNQVHCIEDFHLKFAPRCSVCLKPIMPKTGEEETVRIVALDRSFHVDCYKCEDCGVGLSAERDGDGCYPLDGHILCRNCNGNRVQLLSS